MKIYYDNMYTCILKSNAITLNRKDIVQKNTLPFLYLCKYSFIYILSSY